MSSASGPGGRPLFLVGNAIGRNDPDGARRNAGAALACGAAFMMLTGLTFIAIPKQLAGFYTAEAAE